eukprot:2630689-Amphidinium_carterae.2
MNVSDCVDPYAPDECVSPAPVEAKHSDVLVLPSGLMDGEVLDIDCPAMCMSETDFWSDTFVETFAARELQVLSDINLAGDRCATSSDSNTLPSKQVVAVMNNEFLVAAQVGVMQIVKVVNFNCSEYVAAIRIGDPHIMQAGLLIGNEYIAAAEVGGTQGLRNVNLTSFEQMENTQIMQVVDFNCNEYNGATRVGEMQIMQDDAVIGNEFAVAAEVGEMQIMQEVGIIGNEYTVAAGAGRTQSSKDADAVRVREMQNMHDVDLIGNQCTVLVFFADILLAQLGLSAIMASGWGALGISLVLSVKQAIWISLIGAAAPLLVETRWIGSPPTSSSKRLKPLFDPGQAHAGDCLFACVAYCVLNRAPSHQEVQRVRTVCAELWSKAPREVLQQVAQASGLAPQEYIHGIQTTLWGGRPELELLSDVFHLPMKVDTEARELAFGGCGTTKLRFRSEHYTVTCSSRTSSWSRISYLLRARGGNLRTHFDDSAPTFRSLRQDNHSHRGGMKRYADGHQVVGRRPFPFAEKNTAPQEKIIDLVYHGTFGPCHAGHISTIATAHALASVCGAKIRKTIIGFTTQKHAGKKFSFGNLTSAAARCSIARAVLQDHGQDFAFITVDEREAQSADELGQRHRVKGVEQVFVIGSDIRGYVKSSHTITVGRSDSKLPVTEFDLRTLRGTCNQDGHLGLSSTAVRQQLRAGTIPAFYGENARRALMEYVQPNAEVMETEPPEGATPGQSSMGPPPLPKPMPKKRRTTAPRQATSVPASGSASSMAHSRSQEVELDDVRAGQNAVINPTMGVREPPTQSEAPRVIVSTAAHSPLPADLLRTPGVLKFAKPRFVHLGTYVRQCLEPVASMIGIIPATVTRRDSTQSIRMAYVPRPFPHKHTFVGMLDVDSIEEFRKAFSQVAGVMLSCMYLTATLKAVTTADLDPDTAAGHRVRQLLALAAEAVNRSSPILDVAVSITLLDAHHQIFMAKALYDNVTLASAVLEITELFNSFMDQHRTTTAIFLEPALSTCEHYPCDLLSGGMWAAQDDLSAQYRGGDPSELNREQAWMIWTIMQPPVDPAPPVDPVPPPEPIPADQELVPQGTFMFFTPLLVTFDWIEAFIDVFKAAMAMVLQASGRNLTYAFTDTGMNHFDEGPLQMVSYVSFWIIPPDRRARVVWYDIMNRASNALDLQLSHYVFSGPPRLMDYFTLPPHHAYTFSTSWMSNVIGSYTVILDFQEEDLFVMHRTRQDLNMLRGGHQQAARQARSFSSQGDGDLLDLATELCSLPGIFDDVNQDCRGGYQIMQRPQPSQPSRRRIRGPLNDDFIFTAITLRVPSSLQYHAALVLACCAIGNTISAAVSFDMGAGHVHFYASGRISRSIGAFLCIIPDAISRVIFIDVLVRASHALGLRMTCMWISDAVLEDRDWERPLWPTEGLQAFHTTWATRSDGRHAIFIDSAASCVVVVYKPLASALALRGGALAEVDESCIVLSPRKRKKRVLIYVEGQFEIPVLVFVEQHTPSETITGLMPAHLAQHSSWLISRVRDWVWTIYPRSPNLSTNTWEFWLAAAEAVLGTKSKVYLGHRATRKRGILIKSWTFQRFLIDLNRWLRSWTPASFAWNAAGLIRHQNVDPHVDRHNGNTSIAMALSTAHSWLLYTSPLSGAHTKALMTRRPVLFNPTSRHSVSALGASITLVAYSTLREPTQVHARELRELGFRLDLPSTIPPAQGDDAEDTSDEGESSDSSGSEDSGEQCGTSTSVSSSDTTLPYQQEVDPQHTDQVEEQPDDPDLVPLNQLVHSSSPQARTNIVAQPFELVISPTLPFIDDAAPLDALRGGAPKKKDAAPRTTWEGESPTKMLDVQSAFMDEHGVRLAQIHATAVSTEAKGVALLNWSSWAHTAGTTSTHPLAVILPGRRTFEVDPPPCNRWT